MRIFRVDFAAAALTILGSLSFVACDGNNPRELVRLVAERPGDACEDGGVAIQIGLDDNGNGTLELEEVETTQFVCNGLTFEIDPQLCDGGPVIEGAFAIRTAEDVEALGGAVCVSGSVIVADTDFTDLSVLGNLRQVTGVFAFLSNDNLTTMSGLTDLELVGSLRLQNNSSLGSLVGLERVREVRSLEIFDHEQLTSLTGLGGLELVSGPLIVSGNLELQSLSALGDSLDEVAARLEVRFNPAMTSLGLDALQTTNGLLVRFNDTLEAISFPNLVKIGAAGISVTDNAALASVALPLVASIEGSVGVTTNQSLESVSVPLAITVSQFLEVRGNPALGTLDFPALLDVGNRFVVRDTELTSLSGFASLLTIGNRFELRDNDLLLNLTGLGSLESISGELRIDSNAILESTTEMGALSTVAGDFEIVSNPLLPTANANTLAGQVTILGDTTIAGNLP